MEKNHNIDRDRDPVSNPNGDLLLDLEIERHESTKKKSSCSRYWLLIFPFILIPLIPLLYYTLDITMTTPGDVTMTTPTTMTSPTGLPYNPNASGTNFYAFQ